MATVGKKGDGHREGAVKKRSQVENPKTGQFVKRNAASGKFMDVKADGTKFKGVQGGRRIRSVAPLPPTPPLSDQERQGMRRIAAVKDLRWKLGLGQEEFATRYGIPLETLKAWERRTSEPTETEKVYLEWIERNPEMLKRIPA